MDAKWEEEEKLAQRRRGAEEDELKVIGGRGRRSGFFKGERQRLAGCVAHLAGHILLPGRAMRPRSAERVGLWNANSDAFRVSCYDGSIGQIILVVDRNMVNCFSHLSRPEAGQPDNAMMGHSFENGELAKILIQCDEDFLRGVCMAENCSIARILFP